MTLSTTSATNSFTALGTLNEEFDTDFIAVLAGDVVVYWIDSDGVPTLKALTTDYTLSGLNSASGFKVTWVGTPTLSINVIVERWLLPKQLTTYGTTGAVPVATMLPLFGATLLTSHC